MQPPVSLDRHILEQNLEQAAASLGVSLERKHSEEVQGSLRVQRVTTTTLTLKQDCDVDAHFVHEGLLERAKKLFVKEPEVGLSGFDDQIYIVTSTPEATGRLLSSARVQAALLALVDVTSEVEIAENQITLYDSDVPHEYRAAAAELLAIAAHLA